MLISKEGTDKVDFILDGIVCDWKSRKDYRYLNYFFEKQKEVLSSMTKSPGVASLYTPVALPTSHVVTVCLLERLRNVKDHVTFTLDMEDYYRIKDAEADKKNDSTN